MDLDLTGKNALVGGSSRGIGKATAIALAKLGANVTLLARNAEMLGTVLRELDHSKGQEHHFIAVDYANLDDLRKHIHTLSLTQAIHILVNNTGGPKGGAILDATPEAFNQAFNNHLLCNQVLTQLLVPRMVEEGYGRIINIISISVKEPIAGLGVSNTTRWAVASWAKTMAMELGPLGITINNVLPGFTATERLFEVIQNSAELAGIPSSEMENRFKSQVPLQRFASPEEVANAVAFLAAPAAAYINGVNLPVDGGRLKNL